MAMIVPWIVWAEGARLCGLAESRERAIELAQERAPGVAARLVNEETGEEWQGRLDAWRQTAPPQRRSASK